MRKLKKGKQEKIGEEKYLDRRERGNKIEEKGSHDAGGEEKKQ